jgi:hypothetical protein
MIAGMIMLIGIPAYAQEKNVFSVKAGFLDPSEELFEDVYDDGLYPVTLCYDRRLFKGLYADVELGYMKSKGYAITVSGQQTAIRTELTLIPFSTSLKWDIEITRAISVYAGAGVDYWYYKEEIGDEEYDAADDKHGVGGYHYKAGIKLYAADETWFGRTGVLIESVYTEMDRFGENDIDFGGWIYNIGFFRMY